MPKQDTKNPIHITLHISPLARRQRAWVLCRYLNRCGMERLAEQACVPEVYWRLSPVLSLWKTAMYLAPHLSYLAVTRFMETNDIATDHNTVHADITVAWKEVT